jgi:extracellular factor (EF) 3-hydroxypalmitic acid methyl ester biosynthesis protein
MDHEKDTNEDFEMLVGEGGLFDDEILSSAYQSLIDGRISDGLAALVAGLDERRLESSDREWSEFVRMCLIHPLRELLHQDPFTQRAFSKLRGYPGDAECLDFLLMEQPPGAVSEAGLAIFRHTSQLPYARSIPIRAKWIAECIDRFTLQHRTAHILSVSAGHLREAEFTGALRRHQFGRWLALDPDRLNLAEIEQCYGRFGVEAAEMTIRRLLSGRVVPGDFDLIYATWLFDYLDQTLGQRMVERLFEMLRPGGVLLFSSVTPAMPGRGYLESFSDWQLNYRSLADTLDLTAKLNPAAVHDMRLAGGDQLIFLEISKVH